MNSIEENFDSNHSINCSFDNENSNINNCNSGIITGDINNNSITSPRGIRHDNNADDVAKHKLKNIPIKIKHVEEQLNDIYNNNNT